MSAVTVVICAYRRRDNLRLALAALARQTTNRFAVLVAEEGPTDGTRQLVEESAAQSPWVGRLSWVGVGPRPTGCSRPRNVGIANASPSTTLVVILDADVLLESRAIERFAMLHQRYPNAAAFGTVHWLPPMSRSHLARRLSDDEIAALADESATTPAARIEGTIVGGDARPREAFAPAATATVAELRPELALCTLAAFPSAAWRDVDGFDEEIRGYGYEDMAFGIRLRRNGTPALMVSDVVGVHVWHAKLEWARGLVEAERNLDYVLRRYGLDATSDEWADWSVWWHYHADRGGRVHRVAGAYWAVERSGRTRLELPSEDWVARLGHDVGSIGSLPAEALEAVRIAGVAAELPLERAWLIGRPPKPPATPPSASSEGPAAIA